MKFQNPQNGYIEEVSYPGVWTFFFGVIYFAIKGVWRHVFLGFVAAMLTFGISWLIYPFFAAELVRDSYLRKGWIEVYEPSEF